jgi:hypothetical protein
MASVNRVSARKVAMKVSGYMPILAARLSAPAFAKFGDRLAQRLAVRVSTIPRRAEYMKHRKFLGAHDSILEGRWTFRPALLVSGRSIGFQKLRIELPEPGLVTLGHRCWDLRASIGVLHGVNDQL